MSAERPPYVKGVKNSQYDRPEEVAADIERVWEEFWLPIIQKSGAIDMGQVKLELWDFHNLLSQASEVYSAASGGRVSKPLTMPHAVLAEIDEYQRESMGQDVIEFLEAEEASEHLIECARREWGVTE